MQSKSRDFVVWTDNERAFFELRQKLLLERAHVFGHLVGIDDVEVGEVGVPKIAKVKVETGAVGKI